MGTRLDNVARNGVITKRLASLQSVQPFDKNKSALALTHQDWRQLPLFKHAFGDFLYELHVKRLAPFGRHINLINRKRLLFHDRSVKVPQVSQ